tara:strand:+ start:3553 stop:5535 length:1983 start_codon:yes stop_codon:yes gene_type:complete
MGIRIGGITNGGSVTASSAEAAEVGGLSVTLTRSNLGHAPEQVFVTVAYDDAVLAPTIVQNTYDERLAKSDIWITYGNPGSTHDVAVRIDDRQRDANTSTGFLGSHVYEAAGSYDIVVLARYRPTGQVYRWTTTIVVTAESTVYSDAETCFVDTTGAYSNCPAGVPGGQRFTTFAAARNFCRALADPHLILCENGQTWANPDIDLEFSDLPSLSIRLADPNGSRVSITNSANNFRGWKIGANDAGKAKDLRIVGFDGNGGYSPITVSGTSGTSWVKFITNEPSFVLLRSMDSVGFDIHYDEGTGNGGMKGITKTNIDGWQNYGVTVSDFGSSLSKWSFIDGNHKQSIGASGGHGNKASRHPDHGPLRAFACQWLYQCAMDKRSGNGWSNLSGVSDIQPCDRLNTNGNNSARVNIRDCYYEGGGYGINYGPANDEANTDLTVGMCFIGECWGLADYGQRQMIYAWHGGIVIENCVRILPPLSGGVVLSSDNHRANLMVGMPDTSHTSTDTLWSTSYRIQRNTIDYIVRSLTENEAKVAGGKVTETTYKIAKNHRDYLGSGLGYGVDEDTGAGPFTVITFAAESIVPHSSADYFDEDSTAIANTGTPSTAPLRVYPTSASDMANDSTEGGIEHTPRIDILHRVRAPRTTGNEPDRGAFRLTN